MNLKEFADKLDTLAHGSTRDEFFLSCTDELSARLLSKVRKRTPVGPGEFRVATDKEVDKGRRLYGSQAGTDKKGKTHYSIEKNGKSAEGVKLIKLRSGGLLRRSWQATKAQGGGRRYSAKVFNPIEYASFVEYGHRQHVGNSSRCWGSDSNERGSPVSICCRIAATSSTRKPTRFYSAG